MRVFSKFIHRFEREGLISSTSSTVTNPVDDVSLYARGWRTWAERVSKNFRKQGNFYLLRHVYKRLSTPSSREGNKINRREGWARGGNKFRQRCSVIQCHRCPKRVYDKSDARRIVGRNTTQPLLGLFVPVRSIVISVSDSRKKEEGLERPIHMQRWRRRERERDAHDERGV